MNSEIFTPILKSKRGESKAVGFLSDAVKRKITPFFDVLALKADAANGSDVHEHMLKQALNIAAAWQSRGHCYVDFFDVTPSARGLNGAHPVNIVHNKLASEYVHVIPVVGLERDLTYKLAIRNVITAGADAIAIRLDAEDIQLPSMLPSRIANLVSEIGAAGLPLHVFLDFRAIDATSVQTIRAQSTRAIGEIRKLQPERIVFAASAMASDMSAFKRNSLNRVIRADWQAWQSIAQLHSEVGYADYGIVHPDYFDFDPKLIKPAAKIRYAGDTHWLIIKGGCWRDNTSQHHELSQMLSRAPEFRGDDSWGSSYIVSAAAGRPKYGTLETWVTIDQNSHITHTVRQLSRIVATVPA